jgi:hypothetical protein
MLHVVPRGDLVEHELNRWCWCQPLVVPDNDEDTEALVIHNSLDGRELVEEHGIN